MSSPFFRVACASLKLKVAAPSYNKKEIIKAIDKAYIEKARLLVTPELSITGYTCADLFFTKQLEKSASDALSDIAEYTEGKNMVVVVGMPVPFYNKLYNCAIVLFDGEIIGIVPKEHLANYNEFYEKRWFASCSDFDDCTESVELCGDCYPIGRQLFDLGDGAVLGIELCEDLWVPSPPSSFMAMSGANIIANLSASDEYVSKSEYRMSLIENQSARCVCAYIYAGASVFESTTDLVYSGATAVCENGTLLAQGERFVRDSVVTFADVDVEKLNMIRRSNMSFENKDVDSCMEECIVENSDNDMRYRYIDAHPFVPSDNEKRRERCREIFMIQASGLAKRVEHVGSKGCVIGISGGLDSTLALLVASKAMELLGRDNSSIMGITMPGFGTTDRTYNNAIKLMQTMGVTVKEISIKDACCEHMKNIEHDPDIKDITYENTQARERTQILFDMANKHSMLLVGTGDLSELAMGWCTYNGDHMSMYGVNASVPKTLVRYLVEYVASGSEKGIADILYDVLDTPVSPELLPPDKNGDIAQKTEDNIGPYELHDFFLYHFVRFGVSRDKLLLMALRAFDGKYDSITINKWMTVFLKRFFASQFKRSCIPDSPKVGSVSLSPRGDWRMPSDASYEDYI